MDANKSISFLRLIISPSFILKGRTKTWTGMFKYCLAEKKRLLGFETLAERFYLARLIDLCIYDDQKWVP